MNIKSLIRGEIEQDELLRWHNASIIYDYLPKYVDGYVSNYDDVNFIIINKNLSINKKKKAILHELAHLELNHINRADKDLIELYRENFEKEVDNYINDLLKI